MNKIGFVGLGTMGLPMALNLVRAGLDVTVYNRSVGPVQTAQEAGARAAGSLEDLVEGCETIILMLSGPEAIEATLGKVLEQRTALLEGKLVVNMGTNTPGYCQALEERLTNAGAVFVDAPVSGTREPAEQGALLIMASGPEPAQEQLAPVFEAVGSQVVNCGPVPNATAMKLAVNLVLSNAIVGLVEGVHFASKSGLDLPTFVQLILKSPLGNDVFALKAKQLLQRDFRAQASLQTSHEMLKRIIDTAYEVQAVVPHALSNLSLTTAALNQGLGQEDACAIIKVFED